MALVNLVLAMPFQKKINSMKNIKETYTFEHLKKTEQPHWYPTEWIVRTMLGNYPNLRLDHRIYNNAKILDMGFGDGRNFQLLQNIGLDIYGVEITQEIVDAVQNKIISKNINAQLEVGSNTQIPFNDSFFDVVLASSSMYYINENETFDDVLNEYVRVMRKGACLIANFPELEKSYICKNPIPEKHGLIRITSDVHGLRNGFLFKAYKTKQEIVNDFSEHFENISIGYLYEEYYGYELSMFILVAYKK
jgi:ubiquinone/menaquinone biosynthesis C-methylase UbiE